MKPTTNEKLLAYLALLSGLTLSAVAEYYSILGLTAIFSAAVIPIIIMGVALGIGKITATVWLKQNWDISPYSVRAYLLSSVVILMLITAMGTFGFLSKAHSDQSLVSGDVQAKIAVYDEKIKTSKDNIEANRKALKQMDEAVDQVMGRSSSEAGANQAVAIRRSQAKERVRLLAEIGTEQKAIASISEARAPIAAEVRKVEAEVGPIKYIAAFIYGATDSAILEKSVTWMIIVIIAVFDPLAVFLLLASQISFQSIRERKALLADIPTQPPVVETINVVEHPTEESISVNEITSAPVVDMNEHYDDILPLIQEMYPIELIDLHEELDFPEVIEEQPITGTLTDPAVSRAALEAVFKDRPDYFSPVIDEVVITPDEVDELLKEVPPEEVKNLLHANTKTYDWDSVPDGVTYVTIDGQKMSIRAGKALYPQTPKSEYVQNEEQSESTLWKSINNNAG